MIKEQERHFDTIRWLISALNKDELEANPGGNVNKDNEEWDAIKADPIFGQEGWVQVPRNIRFTLVWFELIGFDLICFRLLWFDLIWIWCV